MIKYRSDIDGLRAIAVLSVVIFHAFPSLVPGGFIGVDIFYVISGFLITSIIFKNLTLSNFTFTEFYLHRTRRIFPALIIVLIAVLVYGHFRLQSDELNQLLKHAASGAFFLSNFTYLGDSGYFDTASESKPLLHLWSLAIEEQFYLFWPVIIYFCWKRRRSVAWIMVTVTLISFSINIHDIHVNISKAFYLPGPRFWELFFGATLAYGKRSNGPLTAIHFSSRIYNLCSTAGLLLIAIGLFFISNKVLFPGWFALIPVLGATLLIFSGDQSTLGKYLLSHPTLVAIGLISYPLYLWHWPILTFLRIEFSGAPPTGLLVAAIFMSFFLAWLTYWLVEKPIRNNPNQIRTVLVLITLLALVGSGSLYFYKINSHISLASIQTEEPIDTEDKNQFYSYYADLPKGRWGEVFEKDFRNECNFFQVDEYFSGRSTNIPKPSIDASCYTPKEPRKHIAFIWGDSHAQMLNYGLTKNLPDDWQVLQVASSGCAPSATFQAKSETQYCSQTNWFALNTIRNIQPDVVIVAQSYQHRAIDYKNIANVILPMGVKKLLVIGPSPHWTEDLPKIVIRNLWSTKPERTKFGINAEFIELNKNLANALKDNRDGIDFVDMQGLFCSAEGCLTRIGKDFSTNLTSWDYGHLTPIASDYFAKNVLASRVVNTVAPSSK